MKKTFCLLFTALCLFATPEIHAQGFLKKIGKALDRIAEVSGSVSNGQQTATNSNSRFHKLTGLDIKITDVERNGNNVRVYYTVQYNGEGDLNTNLYTTQFINSYRFATVDRQPWPDAIDDKGNKHNSAPIDMPDVLPSGILLKGAFDILDVAASVSSMKKITICGEYDNRSKYYEYTFVNVPITTVRNTNIENMVCTLPYISVEYKGLRNDGDNKILTLVITNNTMSGEKLPFSGGIAYDSQGNQYYVTYAKMGADKWGKYNSDSGRLPKGIPVKAELALGNAAQAESFSMIRLNINDNYKIEIRDLGVR